MNYRRLCLILLLVLLAPGVNSAQPRAPVIQSLDVHIPVPPTPVTIAGERVLGYELHLTNFRSIDLILSRVEVTDALDTRLADYRDADLASRIGRPGVSAELPDKRVIGGGLRAVLYLWLLLEEGVPTPTRLGHRIEFEALRPAVRERGSVKDVTTGVHAADAPAILDAPLRGGPWVALYDPLMIGGHRTSIYTIDGRARIPGRFAVDLVKLADGGSRAHDDQSKVANWNGYGADVLAVADGIVADARDDMPGAESVGASVGPMPLENASGNYVTLAIGQDRHVFYEHLQHGSLRVKTGDRVVRGQVIARLGNTGSSSSGPHLHFHVADANSLLGAEGIPFAFRRFAVVGNYETIEAAASGEPWKPATQAADDERKMELPAANVVLRFAN
ncbi:MAG: M23 family metallopeptidase [Steroidobacteraceae bacterium]